MLSRSGGCASPTVAGRWSMVWTSTSRPMSTRNIAASHKLAKSLRALDDLVGQVARVELVATILRHDYLPRAIAGDPLNPSGSFSTTAPSEYARGKRGRTIAPA